jgi:hypothetical protein
MEGWDRRRHADDFTLGITPGWATRSLVLVYD